MSLTLHACQVKAYRISAGTFNAGTTYNFNGSTISDLGTVTTANINWGSFDGTHNTVASATRLYFSPGTLTLNAGQVSADRISTGTFHAGATYSFNGSTISDLGTVTTANIDGGTIDGTNITVGAGKTLNVSAGTLTLMQVKVVLKGIQQENFMQKLNRLIMSPL